MAVPAVLVAAFAAVMVSAAPADAATVSLQPVAPGRTWAGHVRPNWSCNAKPA